MAGFTLRASFSASDSALWDEDHEGHLRIGAWGSWGRHRLVVQQRLPIDDSPDSATPVGPFIFPLAADCRGDEHVSFMIMASSHFSGDAGLDKEQHDFVARDIQIGVVSVSLRTIAAFLASGDTRPHRILVRQTHIFDSDAPTADVLRNTYKGTLALRFDRYGGGGGAPVYPPPAATNDDLLFGTPATRAAIARMRRLLADEHYRQFGIDATGPDAWPAVDRDPGVAQFHITEWESDVGVLPAVGYVQHEMEQCRELPHRCDWARYRDMYARTIDDALIVEQSLRATWAASGLGVAETLAAVDAQLTQSESDASISPTFLAAVRNLMDYGREHATTLHYTRDFYYANRSGRSEATIAPPDLESANNAPAGAATADGNGDGADSGSGSDTERTEETGSENWSTAPVTGMANACDCDECGMLIHHAFDVVRDFEALVGVGADDTSRGDRVPLLRAMTRVAALFVPFVAQGLVTTAFVDSSGRTLAANEAKVLPLRDTPEFAKQKASGHFYFVAMTRAHVAALLQRAGHDVAADMPDLLPAAREPAAWERRFPVLIVEGTATTDMFILPAGEYAPRIFADAAIAKTFVDEERARRGQLAALRKGAPTLFDQLKLYQPAAYVDKPASDAQTLTPFYRYVSQLQSSLLYRLNPLYGHLKAVHVPSHTHGLYVVDLLRSVFDNGASGAGLRAIYASVGLARWEREVAPVMACLQNQLPISSVARAQTPQAREVAMLQQGHHINMGTLMALAKVERGQAAGEALDRHAIGLARHALTRAPAGARSASARTTAARASWSGGHDGAVDLLPSFTALRADSSFSSTAAASALSSARSVTNSAPLIGYLEPWMLQDTARMATIHSELSAMHATGALEHIAFLRNRKLPQADDQITMRASIRH